MTQRTSLDRWAQRTLRADAPRSKSLIITIFGDSLLSCSQGLWLSELIELLVPFGINAQLTRTSAFRLSEEGWLHARREGRGSRYNLTPLGRQRIERAYPRIYGAPDTLWDGEWTLVLAGAKGSSAARRADLRRELEWAGFGRVNASLFVHPQPDPQAVAEILQRLKLTSDAVVLRGRDLQVATSRPVASLAATCWDLGVVAAHYQTFVKRFESVLPILQADSPAPGQAFVVQTLLIHSFRRLVLHDPRLPSTLLPKRWPGHAAFALCRDIYRRTFEPARIHLSEHLKGAQQQPALPESGPLSRFGGLD